MENEKKIIDLQEAFELANNRLVQFQKFLSWLKALFSPSAYKEINIQELLNKLIKLNDAMDAENGWLMRKNKNRKNDFYRVIPEYIEGKDKELIKSLNPLDFATIRKIFQYENFGEIPLPKILHYNSIFFPVKNIIFENTKWLIARFPLKSDDYLLIFTTKITTDNPHPFSSYHQNYLLTPINFIKVFVDGEKKGEKNKEFEIKYGNWKTARKMKSRNVIVTVARDFLLFYKKNENYNFSLKEKNIKIDHVCADYIEYFRQTLSIPHYRQQNESKALSKKVNEITSFMQFKKPMEEKYGYISVSLEDIPSSHQKQKGNKFIVFRIEPQYYYSIRALIRLFLWAESLIMYTGKDIIYRQWIEDGRYLLSEFCTNHPELQTLF